MIILVTLIVGMVVLFIASWVVMLLMDPATAGAYTISYGQAIAITLLVSFLFSGSLTKRRGK